MAIANTTPSFGGTTGLSNKDQPGIVVQKMQYTLTAFTGASADQQYLMALPANCAVAFCQLTMIVAGTGVTRLDLGDTGSATRYVNNMATFTLGTQATQALTTMPLYSYTAADKLLLKITTAPTAGVIQVTIGLIDFSSSPAMTTQA